MEPPACPPPKAFAPDEMFLESDEAEDPQYLERQRKTDRAIGGDWLKVNVTVSIPSYHGFFFGTSQVANPTWQWICMDRHPGRLNVPSVGNQSWRFGARIIAGWSVQRNAGRLSSFSILFLLLSYELLNREHLMGEFWRWRWSHVNVYAYEFCFSPNKASLFLLILFFLSVTSVEGFLHSSPSSSRL